MEVEKAIRSLQGESSQQEKHDSRAENNSANDGISASEYVSGKENGVDVERFVFRAVEMGDKSARRREFLEVANVATGIGIHTDGAKDNFSGAR